MDDSLNILVIEDDPADFMMLQRHLRKHEVACSCARVDSSEDLDAALRAEWHLVLADFAVPGMDLRASLARIRARQAELPVILVSGSIGEDEAVRLLREGVTDIVFKDRLVRLVPAIRRALDDLEERRAHRAAEAQLRDSEERLRLAQEGAMLGVWDWDLATESVHWSPQCERLYGVEPGAVRTCDDWRAMIFPGDLETIDARWSEAIARREPFEAEFRVRRRSGELCWLFSKGIVTFDGGGRPIRAYGINQDITASKAAREQLQGSVAQLHALAVRLQAVREEECTRIAGAVHDELGQSLTALSLDLAWLDKQVAKVEDDRLRQEMAGKLSETSRLTRTMLETVREIAGELRPQVLDSLGLASAIRLEADRFAERSGIVCEVTVPDAMPPVQPKRATALFRILQEALTNVARHAGATRVWIRLDRTGDGVALSVRDDGRGITANEQADPRSLGLLGMRERSAALGGNLGIVGEAGCGTTVTVTLP